MADFYNLADRELFKDYQFLPQEQYRLGLNLPTQDDPVTDQGIVNTDAFANSGGGNDGFSVYNPDPNSIVNKNYDPYRYNNLMEDSFLTGGSNATDQIFNPKQLGGAQMPDELGFSNRTFNSGNFNNNLSVSQFGLGRPGGQVQNAYTRARNAMGVRGDDTMSRDYPEFTAKEVARLTNNNIQDYRQNYGAQGQYQSDNYYDTVDSPLAYSSQTKLNKFKDNYPGYFEPKPLEGIPGALQKYAQNSLPGRMLGKFSNFMNDLLPTNRRAIMENELGGKGIMVNNIGQIVAANPGSAYDPSGANIMAGYNAYYVDQDTFDKRRSKAKEKMTPEGFKKFNTALTAAEKKFMGAKKKSDFVYDEEEENKKKKDSFIKKLFKKKKDTSSTTTGTTTGTTGTPGTTDTTGNWEHEESLCVYAFTGCECDGAGGLQNITSGGSPTHCIECSEYQEGIISIPEIIPESDPVCGCGEEPIIDGWCDCSTPYPDNYCDCDGNPNPGFCNGCSGDVENEYCGCGEDLLEEYQSNVGESGICDCEGTPKILYYQDSEGDGLGNPAISEFYCEGTQPEGWVINNTDTSLECPFDENFEGYQNYQTGEFISGDVDAAGECNGNAFINSCGEISYNSSNTSGLNSHGCCGNLIQDCLTEECVPISEATQNTSRRR